MKNVLSRLRSLKKSQTTSCMASTPKRPFLKLVMLVVLSFASYLFFSRVVVTAVEVKGVSMAPTLTAGDRFLLNRFAYLHREPKRGELIVLKDPETHELIVKRIVGLPCETVIMQNDAAYVNGRRLFEPYAATSNRPDKSPLSKATVVPLGQYFVLGDNRSRSIDSRAFGTVRREDILGVIAL